MGERMTDDRLNNIRAGIRRVDNAQEALEWHRKHSGAGSVRRKLERQYDIALTDLGFLAPDWVRLLLAHIDALETELKAEVSDA